MSRVITFSTSFPKGHPKAGQPTFFVEKIMAGLADIIPDWQMIKDFVQYDWHQYYNCSVPKLHTIRAGSRFKAGDKFSPRIWSEKPYSSKQLIFSEDLEVKKVIPFEIKWEYCYMDGVGFGKFHPYNLDLKKVAANDGLDIISFIQWFSIHPKASGNSFSGQIICFTNDINY